MRKTSLSRTKVVRMFDGKQNALLCVTGCMTLCAWLQDGRHVQGGEPRDDGWIGQRARHRHPQDATVADVHLRAAQTEVAVQSVRAGD